MRRVKIFPVSDKNSLVEWFKIKNPLIVCLNFVLIHLSKFSPSLALKREMLKLIGMKIEEDVSIAAGVTFDFFFPELITIKKNSVIGYGSLILCHEFTVKDYRLGEVVIGENVLIGANSTVLPGVEIGNNSVISACSLVNKDVKENSFVGGIPIKELKRE